MAKNEPNPFTELADWLEGWAAGINLPAPEETVGGLDGDYGLSSLEPRINYLVLWLKCRDHESPANELERRHLDFRARIRAQYPRPVDSEKALNCAMPLIKLLRGIEEGLSQTRVRGPKRRRRGPRKAGPLTAKQIEALQVHGECKGDAAEAARQLGIDRKSLRDRLDGAYKKLGMSEHEVLKARTTRLPLDQRGQENIADGDEGPAAIRRNRRAHRDRRRE